MTFKVDGYIPASPEVALEQGVSFDYPTEYGDITIRSKIAGRDNAPFRMAMQGFNQWMERRRNLMRGKIDTDADERMAGIIYDHLVISWSTTIKSGGQEIKPTRDNFISLLTSPACSNVLAVYMQDAGDEEFFRPVSDEERMGNSEPPSDGQSSGREKRTPSAT